MCGQDPEWLGLGPVLPVGGVLDVEPLDPAVEPVDPVVAALAIAAPPPASKPAVANVAITALVDRMSLRFLSMSLCSALKPMPLKPRPETSENRRKASPGARSSGPHDDKLLEGLLDRPRFCSYPPGRPIGHRLSVAGLL
jgi:hypothetical protein